MARSKAAARKSVAGRAPRRTSSKMESKTGVLQLPVELQSSIISYLPSVKDLKSVCLTCKELQAVATPPLYKTVTLRLCQLEKLKESFKTGSPGLVHIRKLRIIESMCSSYRHSRHGRGLAYLIQALPKDGLLAFSLETASVVPHEIAYMLRLSQRKLQTFTLHHIGAAPIADLLPDGDELKNVTSLSFYFGTQVDRERAAKVLKEARHATSLSLTLPPNVVDPARQQSESCRYIIETLLSPWLKRQSSPELGADTADSPNNEVNGKIKIQRLYVEGFVFYTCAELIAIAVSAEHLSRLTLYRCRDTDILMESLSQLGASGLSLKSLTNDCAYYDTKDGQGSLQTFLTSFSGLESLRVSTTGDSVLYGDCDWSAIQNHGSTLKTVVIDDFESESVPFNGGTHDRSPGSFTALTRSCQALKQLAIRAPGDYDIPWAHADYFRAFMDGVKELRNLVVLRLIVYPEELAMPDDSGCDHQAELNFADVKGYVQRMADNVFRELYESCPRLIALVVDTREPYMGYGMEEPCSAQYGFLRVLQRDLYGKTVAAASACKANDIRLHEPCCEILNDDVRALGML